AQVPLGRIPAVDATSADDAPSGEWSWRERELGESNTLSGGSGLLRTQHAQSGATGQFRLRLVGEWFSGGFLCGQRFPCKNPAGGAAITSDTLDHTGGTLSLGVSLLKTRAGAVDVYGAISTFANSDAANRPTLLQVLGDSDLGVKYTAAKGDYLNLGAFAELWLINGTGDVGLSGAGTSAKFGLISTVDFRGQPSSPIHVPARVSLNVVYSLDNTGTVLQDAESASGQPVPRIERYGLGVNRVDHLDLLLGGEAFFADERVRPFVEGRLLIPSNRQNYQCHPDNQSGDHCLQVDSLTPATLTLGIRLFPWKRGFSLLAAADIGLGPTDFIEELAPTPPWMLFMGAGWAVDTRDRPPPPPPRRVAEETRVRVVGFVHRRGDAGAIIGAIATPRDRSDLWPLASGTDGKFGAELLPGMYVYDVSADGYDPGSCEVRVPARGSSAAPGVIALRAAPAEVAVDCPLDALPKAGSVVGHVRDADTGQPLSGVSVVLTDPDGLQTKAQNTDTAGSFRFERVAPGVVNARVETSGYLVQVAPLEVKAHHESAVDLMLRPQPKE
ncbi:MAG: carboxypeptidase regulatory-like domain-containing protein, partial [Polyangiaceae bacterium]